jgi:hypothetical protein
MEAEHKPGVTLALLGQMVGAHRSNLQAMLQNVETQLDDQAAQLDSLVSAIRAQLQSHRVPLDAPPAVLSETLSKLPQLSRALSGVALGRGAAPAHTAGGRAPTGARPAG